ncbi:MAG: hypothetical protein LUH07_04930 [Lachnospiraceae bacterium]|nr:hypothetical protein [Lachnospiraceae bacterium]
MKSIMEDIYNGKIYPGEQIVPANAEYRTATKKVSTLMYTLEEKLDKNLYEMIEELMNLNAEINDYQQLVFFQYGLSMGLELSREADEILLHKNLNNKDN